LLLGLLPAGLVGLIIILPMLRKLLLVVDAPYKDFVYVAGSFNNWQPTAAYAMKKILPRQNFG
jgi:hypothetical protein